MTKPFKKAYDLYLLKRAAERVYREPLDMTIELDASKLTEPVHLRVVGARGTFTTTIDPDPSKPFGKQIDNNTVAVPNKPISYTIHVSPKAGVECSAMRFHQIVEQLSTLGVTGFTSWFNYTKNCYGIQLQDFDTTKHPVEMRQELRRIHPSFEVICSSVLVK